VDAAFPTAGIGTELLADREKSNDALRLTILAFSGADGSCASPLYARVSRIFAENASNLRLVGGGK
jgi:hypothetical protein